MLICTSTYALKYKCAYIICMICDYNTFVFIHCKALLVVH